MQYVRKCSKDITVTVTVLFRIFFVLFDSECTDPLCSMSQCTDPLCSMSKCTDPLCSMSKCTDPLCSMSKCTDPLCSMSQCTDPLCSMSQCIVVSVVLNFNILPLKFRNGRSFCLREAKRLFWNLFSALWNYVTSHLLSQRLKLDLSKGTLIRKLYESWQKRNVLTW